MGLFQCVEMAPEVPVRESEYALEVSEIGTPSLVQDDQDPEPARLMDNVLESGCGVIGRVGHVCSRTPPEPMANDASVKRDANAATIPVAITRNPAVAMIPSLIARAMPSNAIPTTTTQIPVISAKLKFRRKMLRKTRFVAVKTNPAATR
jgi:hypothetical protein